MTRKPPFCLSVGSHVRMSWSITGTVIRSNKLTYLRRSSTFWDWCFDCGILVCYRIRSFAKPLNIPKLLFPPYETHVCNMHTLRSEIFLWFPDCLSKVIIHATFCVFLHFSFVEYLHRHKWQFSCGGVHVLEWLRFFGSGLFFHIFYAVNVRQKILNSACAVLTWSLGDGPLAGHHQRVRRKDAHGRAHVDERAHRLFRGEFSTSIWRRLWLLSLLTAILKVPILDPPCRGNLNSCDEANELGQYNASCDSQCPCTEH